MKGFTNFPNINPGDNITWQGVRYTVNRHYGANCDDGSKTMIELKTGGTDPQWEYITSKQFSKISEADIERN